ncbi:hypothetical protein OS493_040002 [Desmophyllum pertusum]|uniref:28S rRNA (uridine-N(3))-methyltransferase n=1 Tax=Desmophyllum pertusum TaxID=174260 RepID=A0A9W9YV42_9CNID|nr:hypothetical protein OS493_040002 [Desmophyllum pertusum]
MKVDDDMPYREGVVVDRPVKKGVVSFVNVGMRKEVRIDRSIKPGVRVTVKMVDTSGAKFYSGTVVSPSAPRTEQGLYWGYNVRVAPSLGQCLRRVLTKRAMMSLWELQKEAPW